MGRKSKYESHVAPYLSDIKKWVTTMTEKQICKKLGISIQVFQNYKNQYPELREAMKDGRQDLVSNVEGALIKAAMGYEYTERKTVETFESIEPELMKMLDDAGVPIDAVINQKIRVTRIETTEKHQAENVGAIHLLLKNYKNKKNGFDENWHNDDQEVLDIKHEELELKKKRLESEVW